MSPWEFSLWTNGPISRKHFNCVYLRNSIDIMTICLIVQFQLFSRFPHIMAICSILPIINMEYGIFTLENVQQTRQEEGFANRYESIECGNSGENNFHAKIHGKHKSYHICCFMGNQYVVLSLYVSIIVDSNTNTNTQI